MKKNIFLIVLILIVIIVTGCGKKEKVKEKNAYDILGLTKEYVWVSEDGIKYNLMNLNGKVVLSLESGYVPASKVIGNYFFTREKETNKLHLYDLSFKELYADSDKIEIKSIHSGNKFTSEYNYAVAIWHKLNENESNIEMHILDDNLTDITDNYVNGNYAITNMYHANDDNGISRPDILINPTGNKFYESYIKTNSGAFTLVKGGQEQYESISGTPTLDNCGSYKIAVKDQDKYYIVSEDGTKEEINYIPQGYNISEYCDGYIVVSANFVNSIKETKKQSKLFNPEGTEIKLVK